MLNDIIGKNAGTIWQILEDNGEIELKELLKMSKLKKPDFNMAIGWLAREGKISFYDKKKKRIAFLGYFI
jgi:hypothetical protein